MFLKFTRVQPIDYAKEIPFYIGLAVAMLMIFALEAHCKVYPVGVVTVYDGDSLRLKFENDFEFDARLQGIDAPELTQNYGSYCKTELESQVGIGIIPNPSINLRVWIIAEDSYNRKLVKLFRPDYSEINFSMIQAGCAWIYSPRKSERKKYRAAFADAYKNQIGLFSAPTFCEPSKYRRGTCTE